MKRAATFAAMADEATATGERDDRRATWAGWRPWLRPVATRLWPDLPPLPDAELLARIERERGQEGRR